MEQLFETNATGTYPYGWIGWNDKYIDSDRTPGVRMHLDPHPSYGFYRALTGGFGMTAADWRGGTLRAAAAAVAAAARRPRAAPAITSLSVISTDGGASTDVNTATTALGSTMPAFHPNGDGLQDKLVVSHKLSESAYLDVRITNAGGTLVRKFTVWANRAPARAAGPVRATPAKYVAEGVYTMSYSRATHPAHVGEVRALKVLVFNAVSFKSATPAMFARDKDTLAGTATASISLNQHATISVKVIDAAGRQRANRPGVDFSYGAGVVQLQLGREGRRRCLRQGRLVPPRRQQQDVGRLVPRGARRLGRAPSGWFPRRRRRVAAARSPSPSTAPSHSRPRQRSASSSPA